MLSLAQLEVISFGRPTAISTLNYGLQNATNSEDIATVLMFVRDVELWTPGNFNCTKCVNQMTHLKFTICIWFGTFLFG